MDGDGEAVVGDELAGIMSGAASSADPSPFLCLGVAPPMGFEMNVNLKINTKHSKDEM